MRRTKWAIAATAIGLMLSLWWWNEIPKPYERPAALTPQEDQTIEKAKGTHGKFIRLRYDNCRIYFIRDGQEILIARRTP